jgi:hypothetical protein
MTKMIKGGIEVTYRETDISLGKAALVAGLGLLAMTLPAIFANFFVIEGLVARGDAAATASNIAANQLLFRLGIGSFLLVAALDLVVAWALYVFFKPVNKSISLLAGWSRLVYTAILAIIVLNLVTVLRLLGNASYLTAMGTEGLHAHVLLSAIGYLDGWAIGFVFFSFHLFFLGYLAYRSGFVPKIFGILVVLSSFAYLIDNVARLLLPSYANYAGIFMILAVPAFLGEFLLAWWLVLKGRKMSSVREEGE